MSRGPGRWQQAILAAVEANPASGVVLTRPDDSAAVKSAVRRAAAALESAGRIQLASVRVEDTNRLVAYGPDATAPTSRVVVGLDGKRYRRP